MSDCQFNIPEEIWKAIPGFPGYEVSSHGRVRSYRLNSGRISNHFHFLKLKILYKNRKFQYIGVQLSQDGKKIHTTVHRIVLLAFIGLCPEGLEGCHNDGNTFNNHLSNLRWDTISSNRIDRIKHGYKPLIGEHNGASKLTEKDVLEIHRLLSLGKKGSELAQIYGVCRPTISQIKHGLRWKYLFKTIAHSIPSPP